MKTLFTLNTGGLLLTLAMGLVILLAGGSLGPFFLLIILLFLILSWIVTGIGEDRKYKIHIYEGSRSWRNVIANGFVPMLVSILFYLNTTYNLFPHLTALEIVVAYVASISAITADKFASEIGVLVGKPVMLFTFKRVRRGTSGAITAAGTFFSVVAAFAIAASLIFYTSSFGYILIATFGGVIGNLIDSIFGYFEELGYGNKYTSNLMCSLAGALVVIVIFALTA